MVLQTSCANHTTRHNIIQAAKKKDPWGEDDDDDGRFSEYPKPGTKAWCLYVQELLLTKVRHVRTAPQ